MDGKLVNQQIELLVNAWCERREFRALADVLPAWIANNGLTDGWDDLGRALRTASAHRNLPDNERETLKKLWVEIDYAIRNR